MSRCNFDGWSDVIGEVPWCLSMQTTVRHEAELESDPLWHVQPVQFVVQECRQTTVKLPRVDDYSGGGVEHSLQFIRDRLRRSCMHRQRCNSQPLQRDIVMTEKTT